MVSSKEKGGRSVSDYEKVASGIIGSYEGNQKDAVQSILSSKSAQEVYNVLHEHGFKDRTIAQVMRDSLHKLSKGNISRGAYMTAVGQEITRLEGYEQILDEMRQEEILTERQYEEIKGSIHDNMKSHSDRYSSGLESLAKMEKIRRKIASILLIGVGMLISLGSTFTTTGAVAGAGATALTSALVVGICIFIIGVITYPRS